MPDSPVTRYALMEQRTGNKLDTWELTEAEYRALRTHLQDMRRGNRPLSRGAQLIHVEPPPPVDDSET